MTARYSKYLPGFVFITDILLLNFALYAANFLVYGTFHPRINSTLFILLVNICWLIVATLSKSYKIPRPLVLKNNFERFLTTFTCHLVFVFGVVFFLKLNDVSRREVFFSYSLFIIFIIIDRSLLLFFLDHIRKRGYNQRQIIIIGDENIAKKLIRSFEYHPEYGYELKEVFTGERIAKTTQETLLAELLQLKPHEIFICYKQMDDTLLNLLISFGKAHEIKIKIATELALANNAQLIKYDNIPLLHVLQYPDIDLKFRILKRCFDIGFSVTIMLLGIPVFLLLAIITRFSSMGPVFYKQERIGKGERPFYIYKFRSMYVDAEKSGPQLSSDHDPRITNWGRFMRKTRLDELPQFWNVLKGDMSVVGPRPERRHYVAQIIERKPYYKKLMCIKPGVTSSGQVHYGYAENVDQMCDRMNYDLFYLNNISFNRDMTIILKTIKVMAQGKGK
jgi:exopolysaccharide biosynthesis polyprenyl glycosylphosphotransferase